MRRASKGEDFIIIYNFFYEKKQKVQILSNKKLKICFHFFCAHFFISSSNTKRVPNPPSIQKRT